MTSYKDTGMIPEPFSFGKDLCGLCTGLVLYSDLCNFNCSSITASTDKKELVLNYHSNKAVQIRKIILMKTLESILVNHTNGTNIKTKEKGNDWSNQSYRNQKQEIHR